MFVSGIGLAIAIFSGWLREDPAMQAKVTLAAGGFLLFGAAELVLTRVATLLPPGVLRTSIVIVPLAALLAALLAQRARPDDSGFAVAFALAFISVFLIGGLALGLILLSIRLLWRGD